MTNAIFFFQVFCTMALMGVATRWYLMPKLRAVSTSRALELVLYTGAIRYLGTVLLVPTVTAGASPAYESAIGDLVCATLAFSALVANHVESSAGRPLTWAYVVLGAADMLWTVVRGVQNDLWAHLGGVWTLAVVVFPAVGVALVVMAVLLVKPNEAVARNAAPSRAPALA